MPNAPAFGTITFDIVGGQAPGTILTLDAVSVDTTPGTAADLQTNDGSVTIQVPAGQSFYASSPTIGSEIDFGGVVVNTTTPAQAIAVQNLQDDGMNSFDISGASGSGANTTIAVPAPAMFPVTIPADGGTTTQNVNFTCTPTDRGAQSGTLTITNNSDNAGPSAGYTFACDGLAPNVVVAAPTPNPMTALTVDPAPTADITVTNPQDGFTSAANNVDIAAGAGDAQITVALGGPTTVNPGASTTFTIECDNTAAGNFSRDFDITWDDPVSGGTASQTVTANCDITNAVPSFAGTPAAPGPIAFGTVTNGTTSTIGIDVANDGVGPTPDSDLTIASAATSDPQFGVTINNSGPFIVGQPAVADAIDVSCTPDAGTTGAFAGTVTITHNGNDSPTVYDVSCSGTTDATFSSTPPDGGTLNLGIVPPVTTTPPGAITFSNGGVVDSYDVSCTVTDPDGVFTVTPPSPFGFTVAPGGSQQATFQCTPAAPQIYQADVACTITGADVSTANYTVTCAGQPLVVPTMNRWGLILMALALLALGGFAGRRMMA